MELVNIVKKLEKALDETEGFFKIELDFSEFVLVISGYINKHLDIEIHKCWLQFADFEATVEAKYIKQIEELVEL